MKFNKADLEIYIKYNKWEENKIVKIKNDKTVKDLKESIKKLDQGLPDIS
jgi:hypothetical protein